MEIREREKTLFHNTVAPRQEGTPSWAQVHFLCHSLTRNTNIVLLHDCRIAFFRRLTPQKNNYLVTCDCCPSCITEQRGSPGFTCCVSSAVYHGIAIFIFLENNGQVALIYAACQCGNSSTVRTGLLYCWISHCSKAYT